MMKNDFMPLRYLSIPHKLMLVFFLVSIFFYGTCKGQSKEGQGHELLKRAKTHYTFSRFDSALVLYQKAAKVFEASADTTSIAKSLNGIGVSYLKLSSYDSALAYLKKAFEYDMSPDLKRDIYTNIARLYGLLGDRDRELLHHQKALEVYTNAYGEMKESAATTIANIGACYHHKGQLEKALYYYEKALAIRVVILEDKGHDAFAQSYWILGRCYGDMGDYHKEMENLKVALSIWLKLYGEHNEPVARVYYDMGVCLGKLQDEERGWGFLKKSLAIRTKVYKEKHSLMAKNYNAIGQFYGRRNLFDSALYNYQRSLKVLSHEFESDNIYDHPALDDVSDKLMLLKTLRFKGEALLQGYRSNGDKKRLDYAYKTYGQAVQLIDYLRVNIITGSSKRDLSQNVKPIFEGAMEVLGELFKVTGEPSFLHIAFRYSEKSKSYLLTESLKESWAKLAAGIPKKILEGEKRQKVIISNLEKELFKYKQADDAAAMKKVASRLVDQKMAYDSLIKSLEGRYPGYYHMKYNMDTVSLKEIQQQVLEDGQALVEYFVGDSNIYVFAVTSQDVSFKTVRKDFELEKWVKEMREGIFGYYFLEEGQRSDSAYQFYKGLYRKNAYRLYQKLLLPVYSIIGQSNSLTIVPDGALGYVPYCALLTSQPSVNDSFRDYPYLIKKNSICYAYTANLLMGNIRGEPETTPQGSLIAFAPKFSPQNKTYKTIESRRREGLQPLQYNIPEVQNIVKAVSGDMFTGNKATLENFLKKAPGYKIIHIATHGKADNMTPEFSFVAFTQVGSKVQKLYLTDIYNLELKANMVVLSACETGFGKLYKGEGIASLAQGFAYAGAKSMITTLWSVDDKATADIMEGFYGLMKKGHRKHEALQQAQLSYLTDDQTKGEYIHPYYWSGIVPIGSMGPVYDGDGSGFWLYLVFTAVTAVVFLLLIKAVKNIANTMVSKVKSIK